MELAFEKAWEIGFFHTLINFNSPVVSAIAWASLLLGVGIQLLILKKAKKKASRWAFMVILSVLLVAAECACQIIIGWDLMLYLILYGAVLLMLVGAGICTLIFVMAGRKKGNE